MTDDDFERLINRSIEAARPRLSQREHLAETAAAGRDGLTVFTCGDPRTRGRCIVCGERAGFTCCFVLRGSKAGQECGRELCVKHAVTVYNPAEFGNDAACAPHARIMGAVGVVG